MSGHALATLLTDAAAGRFPPADGGFRLLPPWRAGLGAVVAFTGHAVVVGTNLERAGLAALGVDGFGGAHDPRVVLALAGRRGWIDSLDLLLIGTGTGTGAVAPALIARPDLAGHPRVGLARTIRDDVTVWGYPDEPDTVLTLSAGVGGLTELSFELDPDRRGARRGARLVADGLELVPSGCPVVAAVAPGNAASLRSVLAAGFVPVGSVQLFRRSEADRTAGRTGPFSLH